MRLLLIFAACFFATSPAFTSDIGYGQTQSTTSKSHRVKISYKINKANKASISYRTSQSSSGYEDPNSSTIRLSYRYKLDGGSTYTIDMKKSDELYFYEGLSLALRSGLHLTNTTRLNIGLEGAKKVYSLVPSESLSVRTFSIGMDQELFQKINVGFDFTSSTFSSTATDTKNALSSLTTTSTNISNYVSNLYAKSTAIYIEYTFTSAIIGASYSLDTSLIGQTKSETTEVYSDFTIADSWALGFFFAQGRFEGNPTPSDTTGFSLGYLF